MPDALVDEIALVGPAARIKERAQAWADADPYAAAGVYAKVTVKPFKRVL